LLPFASRTSSLLHACILPALAFAAALPAQQPATPASPVPPALLAVAAPTADALPDAPSATLDLPQAPSSSSQSQSADTPQDAQKPACSYCTLDENGKEIPLNRQQPKRILGFMPNFRTVSAGAAVHPPGWKYNFKVASRQSLDWSSFLFLGLTTLSAEGLNEHPVLGKGVHGFYSYGWRGFLDKTDGTYMQGWFLPSLLHEDTRYYPMGAGHPVVIRALYVISRQGVTRTYGGHQTPNFAGLGGKVLTQVVSRQYYPTGATSFGVLAEKFGYAAMRDVMFTSIREFYPDIAAHYIQKHRQKVQSQAAKDVRSIARAASKQSESPETEKPSPQPNQTK
jgi:hypothetical protein